MNQEVSSSSMPYVPVALPGKLGRVICMSLMEANLAVQGAGKQTQEARIIKS